MRGEIKNRLSVWLGGIFVWGDLDGKLSGVLFYPILTVVSVLKLTLSGSRDNVNSTLHVRITSEH